MFSAFSFCLDCCVWGGLSVFWQFVVPLYCGGSSLLVGLNKWLVKVFWLGKLVLVFWSVKLDFFSLECNEVSSREFWGVYGLGVTLGNLYIKAQGYVMHCWRICMVCLALELVGSWVELSFSVGMEAFGWALIDWCSLESGVFWYTRVLDLSSCRWFSVLFLQ